MRVPSPKTEHHEGKAERIIPLFPELRPHLEAAFDETPEGTEYVVSRYRNVGKAGTNLRTQFLRILNRAGLTPWPKLFHNLRASRETELASEHPLHVVCQWIGNSQWIAARHYLTVGENDFAKAAQIPAQGHAAMPETGRIACQVSLVRNKKNCYAGVCRNLREVAKSTDTPALGSNSIRFTSGTRAVAVKRCNLRCSTPIESSEKSSR